LPRLVEVYLFPDSAAGTIIKLDEILHASSWGVLRSEKERNSLFKVDKKETKAYDHPRIAVVKKIFTQIHG
jgi:hypothetical protein